MDNQLVTFQFGRVNIIAHYTEKASFLEGLLNSGQTKSVRGFEWGFFDIGRIESEDGAFLFGYLVKFREDQAEVVNRPVKRVSVTQIADHIAAKSRFFMHVKSGLIAFHPIPDQISGNTFRAMFGQLVERGQERLMISVDVQVVDEENYILEAIKRFETIRSLKIVLHPSNPANRERWKATDERIKAMKATKYTQTYSSMESLAIDVNDQAYGDILMATDGYGEARIEGTVDGKKEVASTHRVPVEAEVPKADMPEQVLDELLYRFREIWGRMRLP